MKLETKLKKWTLGRWKEEAWTYCSIYNRRKNTNKNGYGKCCTCNKIIHWTDGDAGHFQSGRGNSILFYDKGVHLQCKQCNQASGEQYLYGRFIEKTYGKKEADKQVKLRHQTKKYTIQDYIRLIEEYKNKIDNL